MPEPTCARCKHFEPASFSGEGGDCLHPLLMKFAPGGLWMDASDWCEHHETDGDSAGPS